MIALVLVGFVSVGFLPVSSLPDVDYPTIPGPDVLSGRQPRRVMSTTVTRAARGASSGRIPGLQQIISSSFLDGPRSSTLQFDLSMNLECRRAGRGRRRSTPPTGLLPAGPAGRRRPTPKVNPADQPILTLARDLQGRCRSPNCRTSPTTDSLSQDLRGARRPAWSGPSGRKTCRRSGWEADPQKLAAYGLNIDDLRTPAQQHHAEPAPRATSTVPDSRLHDQRQRPDFGPEGLSRHDRFPYQNGSPVPVARRGHGEPGRPETSSRAPGFNDTAANRAQRAAPAGRQTSSRPSTRSSNSCRSCWRACPASMHVEGRGQTATGGDPPPRSATPSSSWCWRSCWSSLVIFVFLRNLPGNDHSQHLRAGLSLIGHAGRDVQARLLDRQPVAGWR